MSWIVILEWDGEKPPTTFYKRMEALGLKVRGDNDKTEGPIARRTSLNLRAAEGADPSVVFQEGCIICGSESTARIVYMEAMSCDRRKPRAAQLLHADVIDWSLTTEDARALERIEGTFGKRGRRSADVSKQNFVVTCFEQAATWIKEDAFHAEHCPECSGTRIRSRVGEPDDLIVPKGDLFDAWKRHRFASGLFEIPQTSDQAQPAPDLIDIIVDDEKELLVVKMIESNKALRLRLTKLKRETALAVIDAIFCAKCYVSDTARNEARVKTIVALYKKGIKQNEVSIMEDKDTVDIVDCASINGIGPAKAAGIYLATR